MLGHGVAGGETRGRYTSPEWLDISQRKEAIEELILSKAPAVYNALRPKGVPRLPDAKDVIIQNKGNPRPSRRRPRYCGFNPRSAPANRMKKEAAESLQSGDSIHVRNRGPREEAAGRQARRGRCGTGSWRDGEAAEDGRQARSSLEEEMVRARIASEIAGFHDDTTLNEEQAAIFLGVSVSTLEYWRSKPNDPDDPRGFEGPQMIKIIGTGRSARTSGSITSSARCARSVSVQPPHVVRLPA